MFDQLRELEQKYETLSRRLGEDDTIASPEKYRDTARALSEIREVVEKYRLFRTISKEIEGAQKILEEESDADFREMAQEELAELEEKKLVCEEELKVLLLPQDPNDSKNVILEIRAGTGGDEATLFSQEIFRMYTRFAERKNWKTELLTANYSSIGGAKEIVASIEGKSVFSLLKYESGVHRVQRVPETETQGRVHTSAVTVAVLPEADEVDIRIDANDLRIDTFCSSGPGGQSVNTTYSAVRITHIPTGEVVSCQDEKSQIKNKARAMKVLRSRLYERARYEQQQEIAQNRKAMVGSGDRSEKIRTYNFPQNRVTDHRIGLTLHKLDAVMEGDLDAIVESLITFKQAEALKSQAT